MKNTIENEQNRRIVAVKTGDAMNAIDGAPVSSYAWELSVCWAKGEITGEQMKEMLLKSRREIAKSLK